jgi:hypothetical protein
MWGPALYDKCPSGAIPKPGKDAIVSFYRHLSRKSPLKLLLFAFAINQLY